MSEPCPVVSVVLTTFNSGELLAATLRSILSQRGVALEVIACDDGSTDGTLERLARLARREPRLRLLPGRAGGIGANRNRGLAQARAPWVLFADHDDLLEPGALAILVREGRRADVVTGEWRIIDGEGRPLGPRCRVARFRRLFRESPLPALLVETRLHISGVMARTGLARRIGGFDPSLKACEDWDFFLRLAQAGGRFHLSRRPVVRYRRHTGQYTAGHQRMLDAQEQMLAKQMGQPGVGPLACQLAPHYRLMNRLTLALWATWAGDEAGVSARIRDARRLAPEAFYHFERHARYHVLALEVPGADALSRDLARLDPRSMALRQLALALRDWRGGRRRAGVARAARTLARSPRLALRIIDAKLFGMTMDPQDFALPGVLPS